MSLSSSKMSVIIHRTLLLTVAAFIGFLMIAMRSGGMVPEDFTDSAPDPATLHSTDWRIYGYDEWIQLAFRFMKEGQLENAEYAAQRAFADNPGYGPAAATLMDIYARRKNYELADKLYEFSARLWPARHKYLFENQQK